MRPLILLVSLALLASSAHANRRRHSSSSSSSSEDDDHHDSRHDDDDSHHDDDDDHRGGCDGGRYANAAARIDTMAFRLERLASKLEGAQNKMDHSADDLDEVDHATALDVRLHRLEAGNCPNHDFQCSSTQRQCVSDLLVCDGTFDCDNHNDESEDTCTNYAQSGDVFVGHVEWDACKTYPSAELKIVVTSNEIVDYFRPRVWLSALVTLDYHDENSSLVGRTESHDGFWNYGHRRMVLQPSPGEQIGAVCDFYTHDVADCTLTQAATLTPCAVVRVSRSH